MLNNYNCIQRCRTYCCSSPHSKIIRSLNNYFGICTYLLRKAHCITLVWINIFSLFFIRSSRFLSINIVKRQVAKCFSFSDSVKVCIVGLSHKSRPILNLTNCINLFIYTHENKNLSLNCFPRVEFGVGFITF